MMSSFAAADVARYLAFALIWTLAGRGVLGGVALRDLGVTGWLLAPVVAQAFVAVALGMSAVIGTPIRDVSVPLWLAFLGLAVVGLIIEVKTHARRTRATGPVLLLSIAVVVPAVVLLPYFVHGFGIYLGTTHPDAWSYTVFGAYLWEYPRSTEGGLAPAYQWAANLSGTRFVSSAMLGWIKAATHHGDTQAAFGLLLALSTFIIGSSSAGIGYVLGLRRHWLLLVAVGAGAGNWIANAVVVNNLDNLLALSYLPALAALGLDESPRERFGKEIVVGLLVAGALYTYPEFALLVLACALPFLAVSLFALPRRRAVVSVALVAVIAGVLVWPYLPEMAAFLRNQVTAGTAQAGRPAEGLYSGLLDPVRRPAALWALGTEDAAQPTSWLSTSVALGLWSFAILGMSRLPWSRALALWASFVLLTLGFSVFVWHFSYSYGASKFILLGWWLAVVAVTLGVRESARTHPAVAAVGLVIATGMFSVSLVRSVQEASRPPQPDMRDFRALAAVDRLAHGAPVALAVAESTAAHWATYFLRESKTRLVSYSGYLAAPNFHPAMLRAAEVPWNGLRLLLTDSVDGGPFMERQHWKRLWSNSKYTLWDTGDVGWAVAWQVENGYPYSVGGGLLWIGDKPVTIVMAANRPGLAKAHINLGFSQPFAAPLGAVRLRVEDGFGNSCEWTVPEAGSSILIGLEEGDNVLTLVKTAPQGVKLVEGADQRFPFMVGLVKPGLEFDDRTLNTGYCPQ
jgi:hypothetical protein